MRFRAPFLQSGEEPPGSGRRRSQRGDCTMRLLNAEPSKGPRRTCPPFTDPFRQDRSSGTGPCRWWPMGKLLRHLNQSTRVRLGRSWPGPRWNFWPAWGVPGVALGAPPSGPGAGQVVDRLSFSSVFDRCGHASPSTVASRGGNCADPEFVFLDGRGPVLAPAFVGHQAQNKIGADLPAWPMGTAGSSPARSAGTVAVIGDRRRSGLDHPRPRGKFRNEGPQ